MQGSSGRDVKEVNRQFEIQENRKKAIRECEGISFRLLELGLRLTGCEPNPTEKEAVAELGNTVIALRRAIEEDYKRDAEKQGG